MDNLIIPLFRREAIVHNTDRLSGEVVIAVPLAWQVIGYFIFSGLAVAAVFISLASYARIEVVAGSVAPEAGVAMVLPTRTGVITEVAVQDGQMVSIGAPLVSIRAEEGQAVGTSAAAQIEVAIAQQDSNLVGQAMASARAAEAQKAQILAQRAGQVAEISEIRSQINLQRDLIRSAQIDFDRAREIASRGFISGQDLRIREETLLARQQGLSQLEQALSSRRAAAAQAERSITQVAAQASALTASLSASRALVAQQAASTRGSRAYVLRAPVAGRVTAVLARVGQSAGNDPLMLIVPNKAQLHAELAVPASAIGFVKPGQEVRLAVDAFPYQRFGTVPGRVLTVSQSPVKQTGPDGNPTSIYPATVALERQSLNAYGSEQQLLSGMTLSARIIAERQSLLQWLLDPLFAAGRL